MRNLRLSIAVVLLALCAALPASAVSTTVVISQVYGAGGNSGATYRNDYVELFNLSGGPQSLSGWSLQYTSATGNGLFSAFVVPLTGSIPAGGYFLVQLAGGANGVALPTPDLSSTVINMAGAAGKILLADTTTGIACNGSSTPCTATDLSHFIDFVGWGTANFFEGTVGPATSTTLSIFRNSGGCSDTDVNGTDFSAAAAAPRNSASTLNPCGPVLPALSINDVTLAEGNSGTTTFTFTVSLSAPAGAGGVSFSYATADGTAVQPGDYTQTSGTGSITSGNSSTTVNVSVNGDTTEEVNETFFVDLSSPSGATILDGQGQGTITNDDIVPHLSITDVSAAEGNSGTTTFAFQVSITSGSATFDIATADNTATTADNDYVANSATGQTVTAGSPYTFNVTVNGDTTAEEHEWFYVNVTNVSAGVTVDDGQGEGTILNDDTPTLTIDDVTVTEGNGGTVTATFVVSVSQHPHPTVFFDYATADGTGTTANNDYVAVPLTQVIFLDTMTHFYIEVTVNGDTNFEADETFFVNLTNVTGATVSDGQGQCTITNDEATPNIVINEILADPAGSASGDANGDGVYNTTQDEFVELVNASGADLDISGWTLSDAVMVRHTFPAGTVVTNNCSVVVFGGGTPTGSFGGSVVQVASTGQLGLNNGGDTVTLKLGTATVVTYTYGSEGGDDQSLTRSPDITGPTPLVKHTTATGSGGARFSPGKLLTGYPFSGCTLNAFVGEIWQIQGSGTASPYVGQYVTTDNNVVTAVASDGFFIQTPDARADASADTSNGVFVYTNSAPTVAVGDIVNVTGEVKEYYNFTEINFPTVTAGTGPLPMPTAVELNATTPDPDPINPPPPACTIEYECWEGMRIHVAAGLVSGPNQYFGTDPFAEMFAVPSPSRPFRTPGIKYPGLPGLPVWDGNPEVFELDPNRLGLANEVMPAGTPFSATGVLGYEFSGWELWPTELTFGAPPVLPRAVRAASPLEMTVGSLNLLNYNSTTADYITRTDKHSAYVRTVLGAPDVLGVAEVENLVTLQGLAADIHTDDSTLTYTAHLGPVDKSGIDVGFLVRDTVTNVTITQLGAAEVFPLDGSLLHDRPPLLLEGDYVGNGAAFHFAVMVNHTRSFLNIDDPDPEGNRVRQKRLAQAQSIAAMVQTYQTANPTTPFVLVGDYNAYEFTDGYVDVIGQIAGDAVQADNLVWAANITDPILTKQALSVPAADRYSYVFDGTSQVIDHALTTQATDTWVRGMAFGRGNSDAAEQFLNDGTTVLRGSDHDGLVLYLMTDGNGNGVPDDLDHADLAITKSDSPDPVLAGGTLTYTLAVSNLGPDPAFTVTVTDTLPAGVTYGAASGTGWTCNQASGVVTCTRPTLAVGAAPDITITVTAPLAGATLSNTATVSCPLADPQDTNNSDTEDTTVQSSADLDITWAGSWPAPVAPNTWFLFQAEATNLGPSAATNAWLTITVPPGAGTGIVNPGTGCSIVGQDVACPFGSVAAGGSVMMNVEVILGASGTYQFTSTFTSDTFDPDLPNNTATTQVTVGQVLVAPNPINMRVPIYSTGQSSMTITNDSPLDIGYQLLGRVIMPTWELWPFSRPTWEMPAEHRGELTARSVPPHPRPEATARPLSPGSVLSFPSGLVYPWGIGVNPFANDMWISNLAAGGGDDLNYRFLLDGTPTADTIDTASWVGVFAADMAFDPFAGTLWQVNVGGDNCIHEFNPVAKAWTGAVICPDWGGVTERGLAFDGLTDTFFAGTWEDGAIKRFNRAGKVIEDVSLGIETSGLAYNPSTQHLFAIANTDAAADLYVLDVADGYAVVATYKVAGMGDYEQAGLEADCAGNLYAVNQTTKQVLVLPSGETGFCDVFDIPWMTPTPASGPIAATATQNVTLDFITAQQWPGLHRGVMTVAGTTPFAPQTVPVNYTIAFLDVPDAHWADPFIHALAGARVSRGCGSGDFCPETELTRAEMAILMVRAMHGPLYSPPNAVGVFVDVPISDTDLTANFVEQLYRDGVVAGCAQGGGGELYYCPNDLVTRAQMAVFVAAGSAIPPVNPPLGYFTDVHGTEFGWAEGFIEAIFNEGITAGCDVNKFCPGDNITRAQLAVWLVVAFDIPYLPGS